MDNTKLPAYQMGPFPWKSVANTDWNDISIGDAAGNYARAIIPLTPTRAPWAQQDADTLTKAVNGTWGEGINPEAVKDMYDALTAVSDCLGNIANGVNGTYISNAVLNKVIDSLSKARLEKAKI